MEINIFLNEESWNKEEPDESLNGDIKFLKNNIVIETYYEGKLYRQFVSFDKIFAITYEMPYSFGIFEKELNLYFDLISWSNCIPKITLLGNVVEEESTCQYVAIVSNGYKHFISLNKIFAFSYER